MSLDNTIEGSEIGNTYNVENSTIEHSWVKALNPTAPTNRFGGGGKFTNKIINSKIGNMANVKNSGHDVSSIIPEGRTGGASHRFSLPGRN